MLNLDLIDNLYAGLTKEQQQELISLLFKKSKQTMSFALEVRLGRTMLVETTIMWEMYL